MPNNIQLKAKLQAYSRAPFYGDYIRQPSLETLPEYSEDTFYIIRDGKWVDIAEAAFGLGLSVDELLEKIDSLNDKVFGPYGVVQNIKCEIDSNNPKLIFTDGNGVSTSYILPTSKVDQNTIGLNEKNEITSLNNPDGHSIKVVDVEYVGDEVELIKKSAKLRVEAIYDIIKNEYLEGSDLINRLEKAEKNIKDLEEYTQGTGGFLDPYNFGSLPAYDDLRNSILNQHAYDQLSNGIPKEIPDQTKVKNIYDGHIWVYIQEVNTWVDEGADTIVNANNNGILGAVTGVEYKKEDPFTKFKVSIDIDDEGISTGKMSVNGLEDEFDLVLYKSEGEVTPVADSFVVRTSTGTLKAEIAEDEDDVTTLGQINSLIEKMCLKNEDIIKLVEETYEIVSNGGNI